MCLGQKLRNEKQLAGVIHLIYKQWDSLISPTKSISFNDASIENLKMRTIYGQKPKRPTNKPKNYPGDIATR